MSSDKAKKKLANGGDDAAAAVEELLQAAQDDVLLNLRANSHSISDNSHFAPLDPDLMRRFDALKSKPSPPPPPPSSSSSQVDDLESRFAKLKGGAAASESDRVAGLTGSGGSAATGVSEQGMEEDEVEKLMQWAMDAVRMDMASGKSGGVGDDDVQAGEIVATESSDDDEEEEEESDDDEDEKAKVNKIKAKAKGNGEKKKGWFF